jgi:hypothetical protein
MSITFDLLAEGQVQDAQGYDPDTGMPTSPQSSWDASLISAYEPTGEHYEDALVNIDWARGNNTLVEVEAPRAGVSDLEVEDLRALGLTVDTGSALVSDEAYVAYTVVDGKLEFNASDVQQVLDPDAWVEATTCTVWEQIHGRRRPVQTRRLGDLDLREQLERVTVPDAEDHAVDRWDQLAFEARMAALHEQAVRESFPQLPPLDELYDAACGVTTDEGYAWEHLLTVMRHQHELRRKQREGRKPSPMRKVSSESRREQWREHWRRQKLGWRRSPKPATGARNLTPWALAQLDAAVAQRDRADELAERGAIGESVLDRDPLTGAERKADRWLADQAISQDTGMRRRERLWDAALRCRELGFPMLTQRAFRLALKADGAADWQATATDEALAVRWFQRSYR